jgi:hypothetical protein
MPPFIDYRLADRRDNLAELPYPDAPVPIRERGQDYVVLAGTGHPAHLTIEGQPFGYIGTTAEGDAAYAPF